MSSGATVDPECKAAFQKLAERKAYQYIIYKIEGGKIVVDKAVSPGELAHLPDPHTDNSEAVYEHFLATLKEVTNGYQDCRYAVFDFHFETERQGAGPVKNEKIIFFQVCLDSSASTKNKIIYASSAGAIKQALDADKLVQRQANDETDLDHKEILHAVEEKIVTQKMSTVATVDPECKAAFQKMAERKAYQYIIYMIEGGKIVVDKAVSPGELAHLPDPHTDNSKAVYEHFLATLKEVTDGYKDCRYAVFDFHFETERQGAGPVKNEKIIFFQVCLDSSASTKKKMLYTSSAGAIKQALDADKLVQRQANDETDLDHKEIFGVVENVSKQEAAAALKQQFRKELKDKLKN